MNKKLNAKDFILIGVLTALMWIICMIISTIMSVAGPVTNVFYPAVAAIPCGVVMMLLLAKVPKKGVLAISAAIQGILFLLVGGFWTIPIALIIGGLLCDFAIMGRGDISMRSMAVAYSIWNGIFSIGAIVIPMRFLQSAFVGAMEKQHRTGIHSGHDSYYFRFYASSDYYSRVNWRPAWRVYWPKSIEKTFCQGRACFRKITYIDINGKQ